VAPLLVIVPILGWSNIYTDIFGFFSRMAVVTFGGAYAVLAYVAQAAVESWHWLKPGEMLDGLALAETTPGPLVLVLSYVGFLAAYRHPLGLDPLMAGTLGAALTTWVTFIPCFLWIFLGAPYVEILRSNKALSGALTALSAAVVGVIANLALWFALHVLFSDVGNVEFWTTLHHTPSPVFYQTVVCLAVHSGCCADFQDETECAGCSCDLCIGRRLDRLDAPHLKRWTMSSI